MTTPHGPRPGSVIAPTSPLEEEALAALDGALRNPAASGDVADRIAARTRGTGTLAEVWACRAVAVARRDGEDVEGARAHARRAAEVAGRLGAVPRSEADCTLALCELVAGNGDAAMRLADAAVGAVPTDSLAGARARVQRALLRHRRGEDGWNADYAEALPVLADAGDRYWEGLARLNRGTHLVYRGDPLQARRELSRALAINDGIAAGELAGIARHNLGFASARAGDLPAALTAYEAAAAELVPLGVDMAPAVVDRVEALLGAGLVGEAERRLRPALPSVRERAPALWPEAVLLHARVLLAGGYADDAVAQARRAAEEFAAQGRSGWALVARTTHAVAGLVDGSVDAQTALGLADEAVGAGWDEAATEVRATAARVLAATDPAGARRVLDELPDPAGLGLGTRLAIAEARVAVAEVAGDHAAVLAHARAALDDLEDHRALLGASELQATASRHAQRVLSRAAVAALALGHLDTALAWVDRVRSQAMDHPPVVPPDDVELATDLARLRVVVDEMTRGRAAGEDVDAMIAERGALEQRVRDRARTARGTGRHDLAQHPRVPGTVEVAWMNVDDRLVALVADDHGVRRVDLEADVAAVTAELDALGFAMQRVGRARAPGRRRDLAAASLGHSLEALDAALVAPLGLPRDAPVVVSPTSVLFDVPWAGLPSLVARPVAVAPALRLARRPPRDDAGHGTLLLEGPRLDHARAELTALADVVADPRPVLGDDATVAAARELLPDAAVAHLACHGVFRSDNPQFSSLELADGPMFVYDLEALPRVPPLLVLSACQTGRAAVHTGDELLGVTASLLAMGARHVVAALADVPDDLSAVLMVAFHEAVAAGEAPAAALARARAALLAVHDDPAARLTAAAFACVGAP